MRKGRHSGPVSRRRLDPASPGTGFAVYGSERIHREAFMRFITPLLMLLAGCASTPGQEGDIPAASASWHGAAYEEVVRSWGAPARSTKLPERAQRAHLGLGERCRLAGRFDMALHRDFRRQWGRRGVRHRRDDGTRLRRRACTLRAHAFLSGERARRRPDVAAAWIVAAAFGDIGERSGTLLSYRIPSERSPF